MASPKTVDLCWDRFPHRDGQSGPSSRQLEFLYCSAREQLYGGSKSGGKTIAGSAKAIWLSTMIPGNRGLIARQAFTDLRDGTLKTFFELCPSQIIISHSKTEHRIVIRTADPKHPSEIIYRGLGEESEVSSRAKDKAKALEVGWLWIDEPSDVSYDAYRQMLGQLRWVCTTGQRPPYMAFLTSNPEPGWVKDRFIDPSSDTYIMGLGAQQAAFIPSLPSDNPGLPDDYIATMRATNDSDWIRRYMEGSWDIHEGMVFTELSESLHNLDNWISDDRWAQFCGRMLRYGCMDHADTGITAYVICGFDQPGNCYCLEEYYKKDDLITSHASSIKALDNKYNGVSYRLMDPSCESKYVQNRDEMISVADAYSREGVTCLPAIRAKISVGLDLMKTYIHPQPIHIHPFMQVHGAPRFFVSKKRCPNLWKEMIGLKTESKPDGTLVFKGRDHACDCTRYILMSRPTLPELEKLDVLTLPTLEQIQYRVHDKWAQSWDKDAQRTNEGSWF
jgi:PBSX family phage terminase large subunit